ncbi:hypothetical protein HUJ04_005785 [Dendroctonus ponderosae]|uniref:Uncharacterized protein n=1 Tax=Dendroctonus ponderosae TaxID=77166 RepID=A0AAR5PFQ7_DENPD|nr:hypothetical protein HUJ04_005785 [Dendroctonus ponderosae]
MSTQSVVSLPPNLEITSGLSQSLGNLNRNPEKRPNKTPSKQVNFNPVASVVSFTDSSHRIAANPTEVLHKRGRRLIKVSEQSFLLRRDEPVNLRIVVDAAAREKGHLRGYPPPSNAMLFDDDPGIMSEVETSSTGFRRGGKQRSSLPVVRTPSKTLERPLGKLQLLAE